MGQGVPNMKVISNPLPKARENPGVTCIEEAEIAITPEATLECEATRNEVWFALYSVSLMTSPDPEMP